MARYAWADEGRGDDPMAASTISETPPAPGVLAGPDPAWRGLYKAGGISAMLYVLLALVIPTVMVAAVDDFGTHWSTPQLCCSSSPRTPSTGTWCKVSCC